MHIRRGAFAPVGQQHNHHARVFAGAAHEAVAALGGHHIHTGHADNALLNLAHHFIRALLGGGGAFHGHHDEKAALVFCGDERVVESRRHQQVHGVDAVGCGYLALRSHELVPLGRSAGKVHIVAAQHQQQAEHGQPGVAHQDAGTPQVDSAAGFQNPVKRPEDEGAQFVGLGTSGFQDDGAESGGEGQCVDGGNAEGHAHGHGELRVNHTHHAAVERNGNIHGQCHQRGGNDGTGNLLHALEGGFPGGELLFLDDAHHVFYNHDGIVHQGADNQNQTEHGQYVDGVPQRVHHQECAEQRYRNGNGRNQRGAPVLQEQVGNQHHQQQGNDQRLNDFVHGGINGLGRVIAHAPFHAIREVRFNLAHAFLHLGHGEQGVGFVILVNNHAHVVLAVQAAVAGVALGAQLHGGNVLELGHVAVLAAFHDDVAELFSRLEAARGGHFEGGVGLDVFCADRTGRGLHVLRLNGLAHIGGGDVHSAHAGGVHPHAHGVVAAGDDVCAGNAVHLADFVLHIHAQPVRELKNAHLILVAHEVKEAEHIAAALVHIVARLLDFAGQFGFHSLDGVGNIHHGHVVICPGAEDEREAERAVITA